MDDLFGPEKDQNCVIFSSKTRRGDMKRITLVAATLCLSVSPMLAQESDTQQILKLLQGMNGRFDQIEERLDKVEGASPTPTQAAPPSTPAPSQPESSIAPTQTTPTGVARPGWRIDVFPLTADGVSKSLITRVTAPIGETSFDLHYDGVPISNLVSYRGSAYFDAKVPGDYTFTLISDPASAVRGLNVTCGASLSLEDSEIIPRFEAHQPRTMSGSIELEEGKYLIGYNVECWQSYHPRDVSLNGREIEAYKNVKLNVKVLAPDDMTVRDFEPDELFYIAPPQKRSEAKPQTLSPPRDVDMSPDSELAYAPVPSPAPVAAIEQLMPARPVNNGGYVTSNANVRSGPSRQAPTLGQIGSGVTLYVVEEVGDWYKVQFDQGRTGFVHQSLVALRIR